MLDVARGRHDDVAGAVAARVVRRDAGVRQRAHRRRAADHGPAELVVAEDAAGSEVVHEIGGVVLDHRDLLEHHLALGLERLVLEARARRHVAHDVERQRQVLVEHAHVHDGRLARRERVQLGAEAIGDARDLDLVEALAALEQQVLDEMRDARLARPLVARADADEDADRDRAHRIDLLGDDSQAVGKGCLLVHGPEPTRDAASRMTAGRASRSQAARGCRRSPSALITLRWISGACSSSAQNWREVTTSDASLVVATVALRGPPESSAISPMKSPGPAIAASWFSEQREKS